MRIEFAEQYSVPCIVLEGTEDPDEVIAFAQESEAVFYPEGPDDPHFVLQFPKRPQELYTERGLRGSLRKFTVTGDQLPTTVKDSAGG